MFDELIKDLKAKWKYRNLTVKKYKQILRENKIKEEDICYNVDEDNCNGSCQGCSDCLIAQYYREEIKYIPTRKQMMIEELKGIEYRKFLESIKEELRKEKKFKKSI